MLQVRNNLNNVLADNRLNEQIRCQFENSILITAHNALDNSHCKQQRGGTSLTAQGKVSHRVFDEGKDASGLGR